MCCVLTSQTFVIATSSQENARLVIVLAYSENLNICNFCYQVVYLLIHNIIVQETAPGCLYTLFYMDLWGNGQIAEN